MSLKDAESAFIFSLIASAVGIMVAGFGNGINSMFGYLVFVIVLFCLLFADGKGWLGSRKHG